MRLLFLGSRANATLQTDVNLYEIEHVVASMLRMC